METAIAICLVILVLGFTFGGGISKENKQKIISYMEKQDKHIKQQEQIIEDLQKRLEKAGLDSSIG